MHRILEAMSVQLRNPDGGPSEGWATGVLGGSSRSEVTLLELIETLAMEERRRIQLEESGAPITERVEQAATCAQLASAVRRMHPEVAAYAVMSTYDPTGTFLPGEKVLWSGHLSHSEAERALRLWQTHLKRPGDLMHVEYRSVPVYRMKRDGWAGPS